MSRAFVKEADGDTPEALPELPISPHPNYVTARGLRLLQQRLQQTESALQRLADAPAEQSKVDDALQRAQWQRELRWLQARIASAMLRQPMTQDEQVAFGCVVQLADESGQTYHYRVVGEDEAEPEHGRISWASPLAKALQGAAIGDTVCWRRPLGDLNVEVLSIDCRPEAD